MARVTHVKKAQKAIPSAGIKVGDSYYWWKFRYGGKHVSKEYPKRSQLTQSSFLSQLYDLEDRIGEFFCENKDDFDSFRDEIASEIENLKDECQSSLDNMPEHLQESSVLTERVEALDSWQSEVENVECEDYDEEEIRDEKKSELDREDDEDEDAYESRIQEAVNEAIQEKVDQAIDDLRNTSAGL